MSEGSFYVTTPIYYVNDVPHIGHAYTTCAADILARFHRLLGERVFFLTGTDEHGEKIVKASVQAGLTPRELVDRVVRRFQALWEMMDISYDDFVRTTEDRHVRTVQELFRILRQKGYIYKGEYEGWYCIPCETFWPENQLDERLACPDCGRSLERLKEESYFFALSRFEQPLLEQFKNHPRFVMPESRYNEIVSFIRGGLKDQSISRTGMDWGVPVPDDPQHTLYVWFDALVNYVTAVGLFDHQSTFETYWPVAHHLVGKDILRFHATLWPGMLMGAGIAPPRRVFAHGWWTVEGEKMSKSRGNVVDPVLMIERYGVDRFRYFIMREVTFGLDGDFSERALKERCNADLSDNFGNMVHRTLSMLWKYREGTVRRPNDYRDEAWENLLHEVRENTFRFMDSFAFAQALEQIWKLAHYGNKFIDRRAPWSLNKDPDRAQELDEVLYRLCDVGRLLALLVYPFIPRSAQVLWDMLGLPGSLQEQHLRAELSWERGPETFSPVKPKPLFPRLVDEEAEGEEGRRVKG